MGTRKRLHKLAVANEETPIRQVEAYHTHQYVKWKPRGSKTVTTQCLKCERIHTVEELP